MPAAFVLGLDENGYGVVRSLAAHGVRVIGLYSGPSEFGRFSRYCAAHQLPATLSEEEISWKLAAWGEREGDMPVLHPTSDYYALLLARHAHLLHRHFRFHWMESLVLQQIVDKALMSTLCSRIGVLTPQTHITQQGENLAEAALTFPCLVKPNRSFDNLFPSGRRNFCARSRNELFAFFADYPQLKGATICQQIIEGGDENVLQCTALTGKNGQIAAAFTTRKIHQYPPGYGSMCFGRSEKNDALIEQSQQVLRALQFRGLSSLEFKYCAHTDRYYFIEMNPRLPWYNSLCRDAGVDLAFLAYADLVGLGQSLAAPRQFDGVYWLSLKQDLRWFLEQRRVLFLYQWLRSLARARSYPWFNWRDPAPFLRSLANFIATCLRRLRGAAPKQYR
jgi:predicted ATP-grasp superfamily ATP-dependent carboligase